MSGFLSQIAGSFLGSNLGTGAVATAAPALLQELMGSGGAAGGGVSGLLAQFESAGMGDQAKSWVGSGANQPLTAEGVMAAIPQDQLMALGDKVGLPHEQVAAILAQVLPHAVDHATPDGSVPPEGAPAPDYANLIGKMFGR